MPQNITLADLTKSSATPITNPLLNTNRAAPNTTLVPTAAEAQAAAALTPDQTIVEKIDTTISTTIPVWKSQMVIALGLSNQRKALDLQNKVDDVTNKLLARNAAALHKGAVDAEKANQRSVVENRHAGEDQRRTHRHPEGDRADPEGRQGQPRGRPGQDAPNRVRPQKRLARKRPADVSRSRASMLPLAEVYEYAYWCAYICSRWRELAAVRLAEGGHGARLGRLYRQPFPAVISLWA